MEYARTVKGTFLARPNRFIAEVEIDGRRERVHVKNTGRCRELLISGVPVILEPAPEGAERKTQYDLIAVYKEGILINMDSMSPNKAVGEFLPKLFGEDAVIRAEKVFGNSRFDFYVEVQKRKIYLEVKGCTLEQGGVCRFPDAPTQRGLKHIEELIRAVDEGYEAYIFFVIQMERARYFTPNTDTHPEFAAALKMAAQKGVNILAYTCQVTESSMSIAEPLEIKW